MKRILFAAKDFSPFSALVERLHQEPDTELIPAVSAKQAFECLRQGPLLLVIASETLEDLSGLEFIRRVSAAYPFVNTALCNELKPKLFHEATEGLGIVMQLPLHPSHQHGELLVRQLARISTLLGQSPEKERS